MEVDDHGLTNIPADEPDIKPLVVIPRNEWTTTPIGSTAKVKHPVTNVIFTVTDSPMCNTKEECTPVLKNMLQDYKAKGIADLPYNFVVGGDGTVYEGLGWKNMPEKNKTFPEYHGDSIEITHFGPRGDPPNRDQINGSWDIVKEGIRNKYIQFMPRRHSDFY